MNWYTKRAALTGIYNTTELVMLQDTSPDWQDSWTFLDNRIQDVVNMAGTAKQVWLVVWCHYWRHSHFFYQLLLNTYFAFPFFIWLISVLLCPSGAVHWWGTGTGAYGSCSYSKFNLGLTLQLQIISKIMENACYIICISESASQMATVPITT